MIRAHCTHLYEHELAIKVACIAVLRYVDHRSYPSCRTRHPLPAKCRPKFISVAAWGARIRECSTSSIGFNLCENCYDPVCRTIRGAMEIEHVYLRYVDPCPGLPHCARHPLAATDASPSNGPRERRAPALRAFAPPREPVRCTRRDVARGVCFRWRVQPCPTRPICVRTAMIRYAPRAVELIEIEN